jgi:hypothetical protein
MRKRVQLTVYKVAPTKYRYIVHGANPSIRGHFQTASAFKGPKETDAVIRALRAHPCKVDPSIIGRLNIISEEKAE